MHEYKRCVVEKDDKTQVVYFPEEEAKIDKVCQIVGDNNWKIVEVANTTITLEEILKPQNLTKETS